MKNTHIYAAAPAAVWYGFAAVKYDNELSAFAKVLYGEIANLSKLHGYCFASNGYLAGQFGKSSGQISRTISRLQQRGYVYIVTERNQRKIYIGANPEGVSPNPDAPAPASPAPDAAASALEFGASPDAAPPAAPDELTQDTQGGCAKSARANTPKPQGPTIKNKYYIYKPRVDDSRARELRRLFFDRFVVDVDEDLKYSMEEYELAARKWHESPFIQPFIRTLKDLHKFFARLVADKYAPRPKNSASDRTDIANGQGENPNFSSRSLTAEQLNKMFRRLSDEEL